MKRFKNILASVDTRASQHPALQWATVLAEHNKARLKIVDTLPAFPWHVRLAMRGHEQIHGPGQPSLWFLWQYQYSVAEKMPLPGVDRQTGHDTQVSTHSGRR